MDAFKRGLQFVLHHEGGYVNHPADPGGATNKGITQRTYDAWRKKNCQSTQDVRLIEDAEVEAIYDVEYFVAANCHEMPLPLAICVFDAAVNCGVQRARGWKILVDGSFKNLNITQQVREYMGARRAFYRTRPHFPTFGKGWFRRCDELEALCLSLAKEEQCSGN